VRLRVEHETIYRYHQPVRFGRHRLIMRPREGHDLRIERMALRIEPAHRVSWIRDVFGNSIALVDFLEPSAVLTIVGDVVVERMLPFPTRDLHEPWRVPFPAVYDPLEADVVTVYRTLSFPRSAQRVRAWLDGARPFDPHDAEGTMLTLSQLVHESIAYVRRYSHGVQTPAQTLELGTGTCRDMATLMMDAARTLGVAARFASGYLHGTRSMAGAAATHAWAETYLPTLGWRGFDPTLGAETSWRHVVTGVCTHPRGVMPVSGSYVGAREVFDHLSAVVRTTELGAAGLDAAMAADPVR
jgi:transglutaminase-like putative cysteine protease